MVELVTGSLTNSKTIRSYQDSLEHFLNWRGDAPMTRATVQAYVQALSADGLASSSVNVRLSAVRKMVREAAEHGLLDGLTAQMIASVKGKSTGQPAKFTVEIEQFLKQLLEQDRVWNSSILAEEIETNHGVKPSGEAVRLKLLELGFSWKRTRFLTCFSLLPVAIAVANRCSARPQSDFFAQPLASSLGSDLAKLWASDTGQGF